MEEVPRIILNILAAPFHVRRMDSNHRAHPVSIIPMSYAGGQEITSSRLSSDIVCRVWIGPSATNPRPSTSSPRKAKGKHTATGTSVSKGYVRARADAGFVIHGQGSYTESNRFDTTPVVSYEVSYDEWEVL